MSEPLLTPSDAELLLYLRGEAVPAQAQAIERWLDAAAEHRERLETLRLVFQATELPPVQWDPEASWRRLTERLEPVRRPEVVRAADRFAPMHRHPNWITRTAIAAGIAGLAAGGWYLERSGPALPQADHAASISMTERRTARGERVSFRLADGTGVMLGPASRLRYSARYGRDARVVELEGDGYFEVVHDSTRPFLVRTRTALVRDLGTRFALRDRPEERRAEVVVAEGIVAVGRGGTVSPNVADRSADDVAARAALPPDSVVLVPGDLARLADTGGVAVRRGVNLGRHLGWTEGRLVFEHSPLPAVVAELERWYGVDITLATAGLRGRVLTAEFRDKPIGEVLGLVAASLSIELSRAGQRFVLSER